MISTNNNLNCSLIMQESAYNTRGNDATFSLQPVLKTYVSNNEIKVPDKHNACLSDDIIEKLYTVVVQQLTPYVNSDNTTSHYTCINDTTFDTHAATAYRSHEMYNNFCESLDSNNYANYLNAYDPVEHTYEGSNRPSNYVFLTNSTYFSAEPVGQYEIPNGYKTTTYNYIQITDIYDIYKTISKNTVNVTDEITAKAITSGIQHTSIEYDDDVVPLSLGCSIIFSATQLPDKFLYVGIKGGHGGYPAYSVGKVYSPANIKSLGNNLYLFSDVICDNLQFMTDALNSSMFYDTAEVNDKYKILTSAFKFSTTFVLDSELKYHTTIQNIATSASQDKDFTVANTRKLENFNAISILQWLTCAKLKLDNALQIEPATASISPRYNRAATIQLAKNNTRYVFHSNIAYNDNYLLGYAGFDTDRTVTAIKNWGDVSLIQEMNGACTTTNLQKIPNSWSGWNSLSSAEAMFNGAGITAIPNTWNGLSAVQNAQSMFQNTHFSNIPNSWAGLDSLENAQSMFLQSNVNNLPLDLFEKCHNIKNISNMFLQCYHLTAHSADVEEFIRKAEDKFTDTSSYYQCFLQCSAIENYETLKVKYPNWFYPEIKPKNYITLGGKDYYFVEWNGLLVLTEDLTWDVGTYYINPNAPAPIGYYYSNATSNVSTIHLALREAGLGDWRIPKPADWTKLINEPTITLPTTEKYEYNRGITKLLSDAEQFRSVFPYHDLLNESRIGLNPCRIATSTASQFDRANYLEDADTAHNVIFRYNGGYTVVAANYGATAGACIRLVKDAT